MTTLDKGVDREKMNSGTVEKDVYFGKFVASAKSITNYVCQSN